MVKVGHEIQERNLRLCEERRRGKEREEDSLSRGSTFSQQATLREAPMNTRLNDVRSNPTCFV